ncbi:cilia- and flagella-associated protein 91 [Drosophila ficusphila]|uniref:cilia- and flagella-associated protein 91 n=1 Tax=Drosophila ficusphila TaxID=30025 RepID=UPI001C89F9CF|nr:cilia- and flagella-associated protein 91 [Drosophila ficusphila]
MPDRKQRKKVQLQEERKARILKFIQENRDTKPIEVQQIKTAASRIKKPKNEEKTTKQNLTSCLIATPSSDLRLVAGENNPAARETGKQPRVDEECKFNAPGILFLKGRNTNKTEQEVFLKPLVPQRKELKNKCDFFPKYEDPSPFKDQVTQTLYRESSAQTLAYLPEIDEKDKARTLELFTLPSILPGNKPPGLFEVEVFERCRRRRKFLEALKMNVAKQRTFNQKVCIEKYKATMDAFEYEKWLEREDQIQECQMMRLEIVIKMFDKREREMHQASKTRIEKACELIEKRRKAALHKNEVEYQRGMRRISKQLAKTSIRWVKQTPMVGLGSPCSDFYAPPIRYGVDPARRNFASSIGIRAFNMRIDELEKQINLRIVECPFAKLNQWSAPKQRVQEIENNFINETHLDKLYNTLRASRAAYEDRKPRPKCLKIRRMMPYEPTKPRRTMAQPLKSYKNLYEMAGEIKSPSPSPSLYEAFKQHLRLQKNQISAEYAQQLRRDEQKRDLKNLIFAYEGSLIGYMMQFLTDEMVRLKEQRRLHFFTILAQKERLRREALEGGLRQKESTMRRLYEELFQQSQVIHQDVSHQYIRSILDADVENMAGNAAVESVTELAKQIDVDIERWLESFKLIQNPLNYVPLRLMLQDMVSPDLNAALQRYEKTMIAQYIVEDVIFGRVWKELEPFDISSTLTSDLIDRLIDNDLYLFSTDSESEAEQKTSWLEAHSIIRKLIRQSVPGKRWKEEAERIVYENYNDLLDDIFNEMIYKRDNPPIIEPVILRVSFSHENLLAGENTRIESKNSEYRPSEDLSEVNCELITSQFLTLVKKKKRENEHFVADKKVHYNYRRIPEVSLESKATNYKPMSSSSDDSNHWPFDYVSQGSQKSKNESANESADTVSKNLVEYLL